MVGFVVYSREVRFVFPVVSVVEVSMYTKVVVLGACNRDMREENFNTVVPVRKRFAYEVPSMLQVPLVGFTVVVPFNKYFATTFQTLNIMGVVFCVVTNTDVPKMDESIIRLKRVLERTPNPFTKVGWSRVELFKEFIMAEMCIGGYPNHTTFLS